MQQLSSVLGIDIGGTNIRLAHIDRNLKVIRSSRIKVEEAEGDWSAIFPRRSGSSQPALNQRSVLSALEFQVS